MPTKKKSQRRRNVIEPLGVKINKWWIEPYTDVPREELLMLLVLNLSADRMARIVKAQEEREHAFLTNLGQIKC